MESIQLQELAEKENLIVKNKTILVSEKFQCRKVPMRKVMLEAENKIRENQEKKEDVARKGNEAR